MTKTVSIVSLAVMSVALQAQTTTSPQTPDPAMTPGTTQTDLQVRAAADTATLQTSQKAGQLQAASVSAELTKSVDTKKARVGDEINAKITNDAKLPDGMELPKGTKLVGNVVDVKAKSKDENDSRLVLVLNRVVLKDGHEVPIKAAVTSMTAPVSNASFDTPSGGSVGGGSAEAGGSSAGASSTPSTPTPSMSGGTSGSAQAATGEMLKSAQDRVAVGNKPKVMLSAPATPESAGILDAQGENISLDSGTKFTVNVAWDRDSRATSL